MIDKAHKQVDLKIEKMSRHLMKTYIEESKVINAELNAFFKKAQKKIDKLADDYFKAVDFEEKQRAKEKYQKYIKELVSSKEFKKLAENNAHRLYLRNVESNDYINSHMPEIYTDNFNYIGENLEKDIPEYSFTPATKEEVAEYSDMQLQEVDRRKDESYNKKRIVAIVVGTALIVVGAKKLAKKAATKTAMENYITAKRHANDMSTYAENRGRLDGMYRASDFGFDTKKKWNSIKDNRTRDSHRILDGKEADLEEGFLGGGELQYPRDPTAPLAEICNCRCFLTYTLGEYSESTGETVARRGTVKGSYKKPSSFKDTKTVRIPEMNYREWAIFHYGR